MIKLEVYHWSNVTSDGVENEFYFGTPDHKDDGEVEKIPVTNILFRSEKFEKEIDLLDVTLTDRSYHGSVYGVWINGIKSSNWEKDDSVMIVIRTNTKILEEISKDLDLDLDTDYMTEDHKRLLKELSVVEDVPLKLIQDFIESFKHKDNKTMQRFLNFLLRLNPNNSVEYFVQPLVFKPVEGCTPYGKEIVLDSEELLIVKGSEIAEDRYIFNIYYKDKPETYKLVVSVKNMYDEDIGPAIKKAIEGEELGLEIDYKEIKKESK